MEKVFTKNDPNKYNWSVGKGRWVHCVDNGARCMTLVETKLSLSKFFNLIINLKKTK